MLQRIILSISLIFDWVENSIYFSWKCILPRIAGKIPNQSKEEKRQINKTTMYEYNVKNWRAFLSTIIRRPFCTYTLTHKFTFISAQHSLCWILLFFFCERMIRAIYQFLDFHRFHANYKHIHATTFVWFTFWVDWFSYFHSKMYVDSKISTRTKFEKSTKQRKLNSFPPSFIAQKTILFLFH